MKVCLERISRVVNARGAMPLVLALAASLSCKSYGRATSQPQVSSSGLPTSSLAPCPRRLERALFDQSLALGARYLMASQRDDGGFVYEYDMRRGNEGEGDHAVRQAGALWGIALLYDRLRSPELARALEKALQYYASRSRQQGGRRWVIAPGDDVGSLGTVALVGLAHLDALRTLHDPALAGALEQYLAFVVSARKNEGTFFSRYDHSDGAPHGDPSPYYDGEALLLLARAANQLGRDELRVLALREAEAGYASNVMGARQSEADSPVTKGYYQWASLAYWEMRRWQGGARWEDRLLELADWMIDVHRTLERAKNTAYAYEGILPAYAVARARGDGARMAKLGCVIERGLGKLLPLQVGNPVAHRGIALGAITHARAIGGVQSDSRDPRLRIDVTQHQMHALLLARELYLE